MNEKLQIKLWLINSIRWMKDEANWVIVARLLFLFHSIIIIHFILNFPSFPSFLLCLKEKFVLFNLKAPKIYVIYEQIETDWELTMAGVSVVTMKTKIFAIATCNNNSTVCNTFFVCLLFQFRLRKHISCSKM